MVHRVTSIPAPHWNDTGRPFDHSFGNHPHLICYAMKASSNIAILNLLARLGSGFDIVSLGEMERVIAAGGDPKKNSFFRRGKT
jgi:diaminopimelate decarboxylase (EC 4.1.1.20)